MVRLRESLRFLSLLAILGAAATALAADPAVPVLELPLGASMEAPATLSGEAPRAPGADRGYGIDVATIKVTSEKPRTISIYHFGNVTCSLKGGARMQSVKIRPQSPLELRLMTRLGGHWDVVVIDEEETRPTAAVYGKPDPKAPASDHELKNYAFFVYTTWLDAGFIRKLFATLDDAFFLYPTKPICGGWVAANEPVLLNQSEVLRASGERVNCRMEHDEREDLLATARPAQVVIPQALVVPPAEQNLWKEEGFLALAATDARIAKYKQQKETASACFDKAWAKLDPDGNADKYDLVTYDAKGRVKKLEGFAAKIQRQVDAKCKLNVLMKERMKIQAALAARELEETKKEMAAVRARFDAK